MRLEKTDGNLDDVVLKKKDLTGVIYDHADRRVMLSHKIPQRVELFDRSRCREFHFDLVPNIGFNREHVLGIGLNNRLPDIGILLAAAKFVGIKQRQKAMEIIREVHDCVSTWDLVFEECDVPVNDAQKIGTDISQRLKKMAISSGQRV
ncbi:MAG: hypothetical protein H8E41_07680 [Desulfobulbaceae bacterium]|uniref:Uncharacterized protein n=1 Tax=Candidatus Desulfobia pelagia TaxID=2841692 RepID=A0A8J6NDX9_9BACT|nr:hypothetical protein [Candidatus Desulfobia pelagia]